MSQLAILGGKKVRSKRFPLYNSINQEEIDAVVEVMKKGVLSKFLGSWTDDFFGGEQVLAFEKDCNDYFGSKNTVSVNSNSSGIHVALGALGLGYRDEVIVSPYSMSVSATAPLIWNATPVFVDISKETYSFDIEDLKKKINKHTKAIIVVHLFGMPADMDEIMAIAIENNIAVIEDCAQAPGAKYKGRMVGTIGDVGVFSLNYHKHIHTGEGGFCLTNSKNLALKMQLIRNHAEVSAKSAGLTDLTNMIGFNFRLTEPQAAIGRIQLKKRLNTELKIRNKYAQRYITELTKFSFISAYTRKDRTHCYYVQAFQFNAGIAGVSRDLFLRAVKDELEPVTSRESEGVPIYGGYTKPLYHLPIFQEKICYKGIDVFKSTVSYEKGICPNVEELHYKSLWYHDLTRSPLTDGDVSDVIEAYTKVASNIQDLKKLL